MNSSRREKPEFHRIDERIEKKADKNDVIKTISGVEKWQATRRAADTSLVSEQIYFLLSSVISTKHFFIVAHFYVEFFFLVFSLYILLSHFAHSFTVDIDKNFNTSTVEK